MSEAVKPGLDAALTALAPERDAPAREGEQLSLLPAQAAKAAQFDGLAGTAVAAEARRGPGRPKGAKNRSTQEWRDYLLAQGSSPLLQLLRVANANPIELATVLGCKPLEALDRILAAADKLAPYLHQKMPVALEGGPQNLVQLVIQGNPELAGAFTGAPVVDGEPVTIEIEGNQGVDDGEA